MMKLRNIKGQSTLEYIIILTVIIAALLYAVTQVVFQTDQPDGSETGLGLLFKNAGQKIIDKSEALDTYIMGD